MKSRINEGHKLVSVILIFTITIILILNLSSAAASETKITRYNVSPGSGKPGDTFLFLMTYSNSANQPPDKVQLILGDKTYELTPVSTDDTIYSDGKDYSVSLKVQKGVHLYYFNVSTDNETVHSLTKTLVVKNPDQFTHLDVACSVIVATAVISGFMIIVIYLFRKFVNKVDRMGIGKKDDVNNDKRLED